MCTAWRRELPPPRQLKQKHTAACSTTRQVCERSAKTHTDKHTNPRIPIWTDRLLPYKGVRLTELVIGDTVLHGILVRRGALPARALLLLLVLIGRGAAGRRRASSRRRGHAAIGGAVAARRRAPAPCGVFIVLIGGGGSGRVMVVIVMGWRRRGARLVLVDEQALGAAGQLVIVQSLAAVTAAAQVVLQVFQLLEFGVHRVQDVVVDAYAVLLLMLLLLLLFLGFAVFVFAAATIFATLFSVLELGQRDGRLLRGRSAVLGDCCGGVAVRGTLVGGCGGGQGVDDKAQGEERRQEKRLLQCKRD